MRQRAATDVGTAAEQVGRQRCGQRLSIVSVSEPRRQACRARSAAARVSAASAWRASADLLVERFDLLARLGQRALALAQLDGGVEPGLHALADQAEQLVALRQRAQRDLALLEQAGELQIGAGDVARQQHARGLRRRPPAARSAPIAASSAARLRPKKSSSQERGDLQGRRCLRIEPASGSG